MSFLAQKQTFSGQNLAFSDQNTHQNAESSTLKRPRLTTRSHLQAVACKL
jgi:hypothetical protein